MDKKNSNTGKSDQNCALIMAAGGLIERGQGVSLRIAVIHRRRYHNDWSLPKGKQDPGENLMETARREIYEETGCRVQLNGFAGCIQYFVEETPKVVLYWKMLEINSINIFKPSSEVAKLDWLTPAEALQRLTYEDEKELLSRVYHTSLADPSTKHSSNQFPAALPSLPLTK
ncbi:MAG: putative 8-oxo-dGTP diphosphatase 1 [Chloroflexi bacterium]|nr:putative 8-oxo-dGTP diphosphatase 1 [Chloroflexota bacterium]